MYYFRSKQLLVRIKSPKKSRGSGVRYAAQQYIWHTKIDYGILSDEISNTNLVCHQKKFKTSK
ncbi:hypothetical protein REIS_2133 (plasmid) [Rickettsia endosymbiont of Ixodes scapularis]|nr:hypothetical protein REIS_2133 [Rickettsia endosymbiont of Ixodes scapularis]